MEEDDIIWIEHENSYEARLPSWPYRVSVKVYRDGQIGIGEYGNDCFVLSPRQVRYLIQYLEAALKKVEEMKGVER